MSETVQPKPVDHSEGWTSWTVIILLLIFVPFVGIGLLIYRLVKENQGSNSSFADSFSSKEAKEKAAAETELIKAQAEEIRIKNEKAKNKPE